jgi:UDP-N-acetylglucosamine transferase subunit ALG13
MEQMIMYLHYRYIRRFSLCWVPDFAGEDSLAGRLSHPVKLPGIPVRYIGPLSRFAKSGEESDPGRLLILLSGPEPQRTILEKKILAALPAEHAGIVIVRGLPGQEGIPASSPGVEIYNHLGTVDLNSLICRSAMVIARSGYSTIMDLLSLQKKAILIPTPGQPEQEYLAQSLSQRKLIYAVGQDAFVLEEVLTGAFGFSFVKYNPLQTGLLEAAVKDWKTECLDQ